MTYDKIRVLEPYPSSSTPCVSLGKFSYIAGGLHFLICKPSMRLTVLLDGKHLKQ